MVKAYGKPASREIEPPGFVELASVSIALSPDAMEQFAKFVSHAAAEMKRLGPAYDHIHFLDHCNGWDKSWPDIELTKVYVP